MRKLLLTVGLLVATAASAQSAAVTLPGVNIDRYMLNPSTNGSMVVGNAQLTDPGMVKASLLAHYANNLAISRRLEDTVSFDRVYGELAASYGVFEFLELNLHVPVVLTQGHTLNAGYNRPPNSALGAPVLGLRGGIREGDKMPLSLSAEVLGIFPFWDSSALVSAETGNRPNAMVRLNAGKDLGFMHVFGELNYLEQPDFTLSAIRADTRDTIGDQVGAGLGVWVPFTKDFSLEGAAQLGYDFLHPGWTSTLHLGARYQVPQSAMLYASFAPSFGNLTGTPDWRAMAGVVFNIDTKLAAQKAKGPLDLVQNVACNELKADPALCPDSDWDGDKVANKDDACVKDPEDLDAWKDKDGCPELDNDGDAIADKDDSCPNDSGLPAFKGCPDTDMDGYADNSDRCPKEKGIPELGGCPPVDTDKDGLADYRDNCPDRAGPTTNSGCPATEKQMVVITDKGLEIKDRVYFDSGTATLQDRSATLLRQVATVIKTQKYIQKVAVQGHTDAMGAADANQQLSEARAAAVRAFLIREGVAAERLDAVGYGEAKPIDSNDTVTGRANNRRVEFVVVWPEGSTTGVGGSGEQPK